MLTPSLVRTLGVAAAVLGVDRASKLWVVEGLGLAERGRIAVADPYLNLTMAWNRGVNFGLLDFGDGGRAWLVGLALVIVAALAAWARRDRGWPAAIGAGAVIGGALGNVWDRLHWGAVADFLNMSCCGIDNPFAFNVADAAIFVGVVLLILFPGDGARGRERA
ncbi:MAG: signal peptidase II [Amaricoccus sp.]|nr:signal peptidase II [Amaricoccus sp.]